MSGNRAAWHFYLQMRGHIFNGMGGLNGGAIQAGFDNYRVPAECRGPIFRKILLLAGEILAESPEDALARQSEAGVRSMED